MRYADVEEREKEREIKKYKKRGRRIVVKVAFG